MRLRRDHAPLPHHQLAVVLHLIGPPDEAGQRQREHLQQAFPIPCADCREGAQLTKREFVDQPWTCGMLTLEQREGRSRLGLRISGPDANVPPLGPSMAARDRSLRLRHHQLRGSREDRRALVLPSVVLRDRRSSAGVSQPRG